MSATARRRGWLEVSTHAGWHRLPFSSGASVASLWGRACAPLGCASRMGSCSHTTVCGAPCRPQLADQHADGHVPVRRHCQSPGGLCGELCRPAAGAGACTVWQHTHSFIPLQGSPMPMLRPCSPACRLRTRATAHAHTRTRTCLLRTRPQAKRPFPANLAGATPGMQARAAQCVHQPHLLWTSVAWLYRSA